MWVFAGFFTGPASPTSEGSGKFMTSPSPGYTARPSSTSAHSPFDRIQRFRYDALPSPSKVMPCSMPSPSNMWYLPTGWNMGFGPLRTNDPRSPSGRSPVMRRRATSTSSPTGNTLPSRSGWCSWLSTCPVRTLGIVMGAPSG